MVILTKVLGVRLSEKESHDLQERAKKNGLTVSKYIREIILIYLYGKKGEI